MAQEIPDPVRRSPRRFGTIVTALLAGVAGGLVAPLILPRLERNIRPATKSIFKTGITLYQLGREKAAELGELAGDMMAEARAECDAEQAVTSVEADSVAAAANEVVKLRASRGKEAGAPNA